MNSDSIFNLSVNIDLFDSQTISLLPPSPIFQLPSISFTPHPSLILAFRAPLSLIPFTSPLHLSRFLFVPFPFTLPLLDISSYLFPMKSLPLLFSFPSYPFLSCSLPCFPFLSCSRPCFPFLSCSLPCFPFLSCSLSHLMPSSPVIFPSYPFLSCSLSILSLPLLFSSHLITNSPHLTSHLITSSPVLIPILSLPSCSLPILSLPLLFSFPYYRFLCVPFPS